MRAVVDQLASIDIPAGTCLLFASQPGTHLEGANPAGGTLLDTRSNGNALYATYLCRYATGASLLGQSAAAPATEYSVF